VGLELGREDLVVFGGHDLHGDTDVVDFLLHHHRRVGHRDAVDQAVVFLRAELQYGPATVAVAHGADLLILRFQGLCELDDFGLADLFGVAAQKRGQVELGPVSTVGLRQDVRVELLACIAAEELSMVLTQIFMAACFSEAGTRWCFFNLQVRNVDCHIGFSSVVVGQKTSVGKGPTVCVVDDQDRLVCVRPGHVGIFLCELGILALRRPVPFESSEAAVFHGSRIVGAGSSCFRSVGDVMSFFTTVTICYIRVRFGTKEIYLPNHGQRSISYGDLNVATRFRTMLGCLESWLKARSQSRMKIVR
jgi:hypothetical protein